MKKKSLCLTVLISVFAASLSFGIMFVVFAASDPVLIGVEIEDKYEYNSEYTLPTGTLKLGTASKQSTASIIFPDGSSVKEGRVTLSQEGFYTLVFTAEFDGNFVKEERCFSVEKNLFTVNKPSSSVVYGDYDAAEHDVRFGNTGSVSGAYVKLSQGDVLTYNKIIDLSGATKRDIIMNLVITPETIGVYDFNYAEIVLTDAYDPENFVTVSATYNEGWTTSAVYLLGKANCGQRFAGWEHNTPTIHYGNYGYPIRLRFDGNIADYPYWFNSMNENSLAVSMDYEQRQLHHIARANQEISTMITDLDSSKDHSSLWKGFTTGEVFLSVKCDGYKGSHAGFVITEIMGEPVTSVGEFERSAPYVEKDFREYAENDLPYGVVNVPYPLFKAEGKSVYFRNVTLKEKVYRDYYGEKVQMKITDGAFIPDVAGTYTVEHTVTDALGNVTVGLYDIEVRREKAAITVSLAEDAISSGVAGNLIDLPEVSSEGGSGKLVINYSVSFGGKAVEVSDKKFRPTIEGTYIVIITATDYLGDFGESEYFVNVSAGNAPVFTDEIVLPRYFISGNVYELPVVNAYNFTDGTGSVVPVSISYLDGEMKKKARGNKITPIAVDSGDITTVYYTATLNGVKTEKQIDVPTIIVRDDMGNIKIGNLFYTAGGNRVKVDEDYLTFVAGQNNSEFEYVNPVTVHDIDVRFSGVAGATNFSAVTLKLTDSLNPVQTLTFTFTVGAETKFYVNGDKSNVYDVKKSFANESDIFSLSVNELNHTVKFDRTSAISVPIETYL
ncbi:MAG: hypothetical protein IJR61_06895, partial [Clostridia bacterium]|nr:hypothetical protein [Clostridia bacterium]